MLIDVICYKIKQKLANIHCDRYKNIQIKLSFLYSKNYNILGNTGIKYKQKIRSKNERRKRSMVMERSNLKEIWRMAEDNCWR